MNHFCVYYRISDEFCHCILKSYEYRTRFLLFIILSVSTDRLTANIVIELLLMFMLYLLDSKFTTIAVLLCMNDRGTKWKNYGKFYGKRIRKINSRNPQLALNMLKGFRRPKLLVQIDIFVWIQCIVFTFLYINEIILQHRKKCTDHRLQEENRVSLKWAYMMKPKAPTQVSSVPLSMRSKTVMFLSEFLFVPIII